MVAPLRAAMVLAPTHVNGFYMSTRETPLVSSCFHSRSRAKSSMKKRKPLWRTPTSGQTRPARRRKSANGRRGLMRSLSARDLCAQPFFLFAQFRRERLAEILRVEHLTQFEFISG